MSRIKPVFVKDPQAQEIFEHWVYSAVEWDINLCTNIIYTIIY